MSWKKVKLGDVLTESCIVAETPDPDKRIRVRLHVQGVEKRPLENEVQGATRQFIRSAGQFIYGKQNFHKGAFGIIPEHLDGFETSSDIPSFDVGNQCLPEWVFYFFKIGNRYLELEQLARGVGSKRIHPNQIFELEIPLPPVEEQYRLIQKYERVEADFSNLAAEFTHQLSLLKKLRQSLLQDAVQGRLVAQDAREEPAAVLLEKIKAEKEKIIQEKKIKKSKPLPPIKEEEIPFEVPEGWVWCRLGEIALFSKGGKSIQANPQPASNTCWGVLKTSAVTSGEFIEVENKEFENKKGEFADILVQKGDLLFCRASGSKGLAGTSCIVRTQPQANLILSDKTIRYHLSGLVFTEYLQIWNSSSFSKYYYNSLSTGKSTSMNNITREQFDEMILPLPPLPEQHRIVEKLESLLAHCDALEQQVLESPKAAGALLQVALKEALERPVEVII